MKCDYFSNHTYDLSYDLSKIRGSVSNFLQKQKWLVKAITAVVRITSCPGLWIIRTDILALQSLNNHILPNGSPDRIRTP